jgi:hypothetical protein
MLLSRPRLSPRRSLLRLFLFASMLAATTGARANTPLTITVHPDARQTFQGFGASLVEDRQPYGRISQADRDSLAGLVWHDCRFRILRLWFSPPTFATHPGERTTAEFVRDYMTSGMIADAQRTGATTLLLAPNSMPSYLGKGDVITSRGITDYANLLADFIRKVKDENGITFAASGVLNEPHDAHPLLEANQWADMVKAFRKALDARGLQSVAIIAPEHASGGDAYCMQALESIRRDPEAWRALGGAASHSYNMGVTEPMAALVGDKPFWMTEAAANGPEEPCDALAGASLAARVLNDLNHGTTHWVHFIAYHLADPRDDQTRIIRYWTEPFHYEMLQKYWYYQQLARTFEVGAVFRHSTSSLGDPEMTWTYGKKPKLIAAGRQGLEPDGEILRPGVVVPDAVVAEFLHALGLLDRSPGTAPHTVVEREKLGRAHYCRFLLRAPYRACSSGGKQTKGQEYPTATAPEGAFCGHFGTDVHKELRWRRQRPNRPSPTWKSYVPVRAEAQPRIAPLPTAGTPLATDWLAL